MVISNMPKLPLKVLETLREADFWLGKEEVGTLQTFLLGKPQRTSNDQMVAEILIPHVPNADYFHNSQPPWKQMQTTGFQAFLDVEQARYTSIQMQSFFQEEMLCLHKAYFANDDPLTIAFTQQTVCVSWAPQVTRSDFILELFCGGFGGWKLAQAFMNKHCKQNVRMLGVDHDLSAVIQYAITHDAAIFTPTSPTALDSILKNDKDIVFHQGVNDLPWLQHVAVVRPKTATVSAPCPSWSSSGGRQGLQDDNGNAFASAWKALRILQPQIVGVEQVCGFRSHPHFEVVLEIARWAGYELQCDHVYDLAEMTPTRRPRWLAIFMRQDCQPPEDWQWTKWIKWMDRTPEVFGAFDDLSEPESLGFQPSVEVATMYFDDSLMPGTLRAWTKAEIIQHRIPGKAQKQGIFMRAYGFQHELPYHVLLSRGLFGHFVRQNDVFRFWTPWEIAMMHILPAGLVMVKPLRTSYQLLGNLIAVPHALLVLFNMNTLQGNTELNASDLFMKLMRERYTVANTHRVQDDYAWYVGSKQETEKFQKKLKSLIHQLSWDLQQVKDRAPMIPDGVWWHPDHGIQCDSTENIIPPTMNYMDTQVEGIQCQLQLPGDIDLRYEVPSSFPAICILKTWQGEFLPKIEEPCQLISWRPTAPIVELVPKMSTNIAIEEEMPESAHNRILLLSDGKTISLIEAQAHLSWQQQCDTHEILENGMTDHFGQIPASTIVDDLTTIYVGNPPILHELSPNMHFEALDEISMHAIKLPQLDKLKIVFRGPTHAISHVLHLWHQTLTPEWQQWHGRQWLYQEIDENEGIFLLQAFPAHRRISNTMIPANALMKILPIRVLQTGLQFYALSEDDHNGIPCLFKYHGRSVATIRMAPHQRFEPLLSLIRHSFHLQEHGQAPSLVSRGRRCANECTPQDLLEVRQAYDPNARRFIVLHIVLPMVGGGLPDFTSKNAQRHMIQTKVATLLLECGMQPAQISTATSTLVERIGWPKLQHLCYVESHSTKYDTLAQLCYDSAIAFPATSPMLRKIDGRMSKQAKQQHHHVDEDFEVDTYILQEGYFLNEDSTAATVLSSFQPRSNGVYLANIKQAEKWLTTQQPISEDELAMLVTGMNQPSTVLPWRQITAPALNYAGKSVLLQGALIQFGTKQVATPETSTIDEPTSTVHVCAVAVYRDEHDQPTWEAILGSPVKTVKSLLALQGFAGLMKKRLHQGLHDAERSERKTK